MYYARTSDHGYEICVEHLVMAGTLAGAFASQFNNLNQGMIAGLFHDIGKYSAEFQQMIRNPEKPAHVDHSSAGMKLAQDNNNLSIAFAIGGHHAGLPDGGSPVDEIDFGTLYARLKRQIPDFSGYGQQFGEIEWPKQEFYKDPYSLMMSIRMLFSTLIDADRLDAEFFTKNSDRAERSLLISIKHSYGDCLAAEEMPDISSIFKQCENAAAVIKEQNDKILVTLNKISENKAQKFFQNKDKSFLDEKRCKLLHDCIDAGKDEHKGDGIYTLTAPTGSGKTNASISFALEHAVTYHKSRIIYVIPYTSIIDQTVDTFEKEFGEENVLPHYAEASYQLKDEDERSESDVQRNLASENWNSPIVVTTAVQFFESLYSNKTSKCRKLHNIANSVIVFDEAQTLPVSYLKPCIQAISELTQRYHVSAVLCTATQPALESLFCEAFGKDDYKIPEISPMNENEYLAFTRNHIELNVDSTITLDDLAEELNSYEEVLCVVNTRKEAQYLYSKMAKTAGGYENGYFCLTTLLCAVDRVKLLDEIRTRLRNDLRCVVVSTSLIEAGVDVDFPVAYREEAGLDSILQTAGRCNREGKRPVDESVVKVFSTKEGRTSLLSQNVQVLHSVIGKFENLATPNAIYEYFRQLFNDKGQDALDTKKILKAHREGVKGRRCPFEIIAKRFKLIDTPTIPVYIPLPGEGENLCRQLINGEYSRTLFRKLGKYSVNIWPKRLQELQEGGVVIEYGDELHPEDSYFVLRNLNNYDRCRGLYFENSAITDGIFI